MLVFIFGGWVWRRLQALRLDEGVDVKAYFGGYKVGTIKDGEYLRYSVDITEDGTTGLTLVEPQNYVPPILFWSNLSSKTGFQLWRG